MKGRRWAALLTLPALLTLGSAQTEFPLLPSSSAPASMVVYTLIPELITLRTSSAPVTFDINPGNFPPARWPATYLSGPRLVSVYASTPQAWTLQLEVHDIVNEAGAPVVPASRLSFRVDGGPWVQATGGPQVIHSQVGPSRDWLNLQLELKLELRGGEPGGAYVADLALSALVLP